MLKTVTIARWRSLTRIAIEPPVFAWTAIGRLRGRSNARLFLILIWVKIALGIEPALPSLLRLPPATRWWRWALVSLKHARLMRSHGAGWKLAALLRAGAAIAALRPLTLYDDFGVASLRGILFWKLHMYCLEEGLLFTCGKIAPESQWNTRDHQWSYANPRQPVNHDTGGIHHPADDVIHPFVQRNREQHAISSFAKDAELIRRDTAPIDQNTAAHSLDRFGRRYRGSKNVIFLFEPELRMHHAIGELAIVREQ